jgi:hypothetical protein
MKQMDAAEFYNKVADILGEHHRHAPAWTGNTKRRWDRRLGSGRFPGHGIVRFFSATNIHVAMIHPPVNKTFKSPEAALKAIRRAEMDEILSGPSARAAAEKRQIDSMVRKTSAEVVNWLTEGPKPKASGASAS